MEAEVEAPRFWLECMRSALRVARKSSFPVFLGVASVFKLVAGSLCGEFPCVGAGNVRIRTAAAGLQPQQQ